MNCTELLSVNKLINRIIFSLLFFALNDSFLLNAQFNLVPNPGFETYTACPNASSQLHFAVPWKGTNNSSEYFNICGGIGVSTPYTGSGFQYPRSGDAFAGQWFVNIIGVNYREYMQVALTKTLIAGQCYLCKFYVNNAEVKYGCNNIAAYLSVNSFTNITQTFTSNVISYTPQIVAFSNPIIKDSLGWIEIGGVFVASGGEKYLSIGNFKTDSNTDTITLDYGSYGGAYYFVDDVSLEQIFSPIWLHDTIIQLGDSVFIGSNFGGLSCNWFNLNGQQIDSIPGFYVKPITDTKYIAHHTFCGNTYIDTIEVKINTNLVGLYDHSNSNRTDFYPQPVNDILTITNIEKEVSKQKVIVYDIFGKTIKEEEIFIEDGKAKLDVSLLENGYYLLQIKSNSKTRTDRFFVCH